MLIIDPEMYEAYQRTHGELGTEPRPELDPGFGDLDIFRNELLEHPTYGDQDHKDTPYYQEETYH